jgi:hypothetical protein
MRGRIMERTASETLLQVIFPILDLRSNPSHSASLETQLLAGDMVTVLEDAEPWSLVKNERDGQEGFVWSLALSSSRLPPTHRVRALRTVVLEEPNIHCAEYKEILLMNSRVAVINSFPGGPGTTSFVEVEGHGWIPSIDVVPLNRFEKSPAEVASRYLGIPYRYGGSTAECIDCSALVQQAFLACGMVLPRNSGEQEAWGGNSQIHAFDSGKPGRQTCVFWKGHVGIMESTTHLLHANDVDMQVIREPLSRVIKRYGKPRAYRSFVKINK